ncbi:MAG TPA: amidohydrolase family protein [Candidatus Limnocylindrales bacterium]|nr:amidohydrolase family protein [Candidatus Limnocylindrales bacterium]
MDIERLPAFLADPAPEAGRTTLVGGHVVDEGGRRSREPQSIHVRDGRIEAIAGPDDGIPDGARVIDVTGATVLTGLIDAHVHASMLDHADHAPHPAKGAEPIRDGVAGHLVARTLRDLLRHGVTTIRDVGAHGDVLLDARQAVRYGAFAAPRMLLCGRIVSATAPGGRFFPGMYREADGPDDIRRAVREQIRAGADFVKIMSTGARSVELENPLPSQVTRAEMDAFVAEAHRQEYRAAAHCEGLAGTELAIEAGIDTVEHGFHLHERPELLERMAERGMVLVPTLDFLHHVAESDSWTAELEAQGVENLDHAQRTLEAARRAGVVIAAGSDGATADGLAREIGRLAEHGLSTAQAIAAATAGSAQALGIERVVGRLLSGARADLLVIDGDPLADLELVGRPDRISLVLRDGRVVAGTMVEPRVTWAATG